MDQPSASKDCEKKKKKTKWSKLVSTKSSEPTFEFLRPKHPMECTHPFTVRHILANIFGYLDVKSLHNVRLVSNSNLWQSVSTMELLKKGVIRKTWRFPRPEPRPPQRPSKCRKALKRLLQKCAISTPFLTLSVKTSSELNFYKKLTTLLTKVGHLRYGKCKNPDILELSRIIQDLPHVHTVHLHSPGCFQYNSTENLTDEEITRQADLLFEKLRRLQKLSLDFHLPSELFKGLLNPVTRDIFHAITSLTFPNVHLPKLNNLLSEFLEKIPPWSHLDTVKLAIKLTSEPPDYSLIRQFLLHLENTATVQTLELTFQGLPGQSTVNENEAANWSKDDWFLPQSLSKITTLRLRAVISKETPGVAVDSSGPVFVPPEFTRTLMTALRLPNLKIMFLCVLNKQEDRLCSWGQMIQVVEAVGQPCPTLKEMIVTVNGETSDSPFFPVHLWPNLTSLKIHFKVKEFYGVSFLKSIWRQYTGLERLILNFKVESMATLTEDLDHFLWGKTLLHLSVDRQGSIVNLKKLKTLEISGQIPREYFMTDFALNFGLAHLKNLQRLNITQHNMFTVSAIRQLKQWLGPWVFCNINTDDQDEQIRNRLALINDDSQIKVGEHRCRHVGTPPVIRLD